MRYGPIVLVVLLLGLCLLPQGVFLGTHGRFPLYADTSFLEVGMTQEKVLDRLGPPHLKYDDPDGETWYYWRDCLGACHQAIRFTSDGKVCSTWI